MGVDLARLLERAQEMADACRLAEGNPGLELGLLARRGLAGRAATRSASPEPGRLRPLGRAAARRVDREARQGPRPGARRVGRRRPTGRRRRCASAARTSSARSSSAGSSRPPSPARSSASTRSTSPTSRRRRTRRAEMLASGEDPLVEPEGSVDELFAQARPGDYVCDPGLRQPDAGGGRRSSRALARARAASDGLRRHARVRPALPALDRPAAQGRAADRALPPGRRRHRRRARDPGPAVRVREADPRAGGGRLRVAAGARPPRRAHSSGGGVDAARHDRPRPHGRQHDEAPRGARARHEDVRPGRRVDGEDARGAARPARRAARRSG